MLESDISSVPLAGNKGSDSLLMDTWGDGKNRKESQGKTELMNSKNNINLKNVWYDLAAQPEHM